jgi:hypothetical protein
MSRYYRELIERHPAMLLYDEGTLDQRQTEFQQEHQAWLVDQAAQAEYQSWLTQLGAGNDLDQDRR